VAAFVSGPVADRSRRELSGEVTAGESLAPEVDMVNHPPHYGAHPSGVEAITNEVVDPEQVLPDAPQATFSTVSEVMRKIWGEENFPPPQPSFYLPTRANREGESQGLPTGNDMPSMHDVVLEEITELMQARKAIGIERYGHGLQPFNGRDAGLDAWEELGDLLVYFRQLRYEHAYMLETLDQVDDMLDEQFEMEPGCSQELRARIRMALTIALRTGPKSSDG